MKWIFFHVETMCHRFHVEKCRMKFYNNCFLVYRGLGSAGMTQCSRGIWWILKKLWSYKGDMLVNFERPNNSCFLRRLSSSVRLVWSLREGEYDGSDLCMECWRLIAMVGGVRRRKKVELGGWCEILLGYCIWRDDQSAAMAEANAIRAAMRLCVKVLIVSRLDFMWRLSSKWFGKLQLMHQLRTFFMIFSL